MKSLVNIVFKKKYFNLFILVSIVPIIIIISLLYLPIKNLLREEAMKSDIYKVKQLRNVMDEKTTEIYNTAIQISLDNRITEFLYMYPPIDYSRNINIRDISKMINNYMIGNKFISFIAVYYKNSSMVITNEGKYNSDYFFEHILKYENMHSSEAKELMSNTYYNEYLPSRNISSVAQINGRYITYIQSIPISNKDAPASIIMLIKEKNILDIVGDANLECKEQVMFVNRNGDTVFSMGGMCNFLPEELIRTNSDEDSYVFKRSGITNVIISYVKSNTSNWTYIAITNMDKTLLKVNKVRNLTIIIIIFTLGFSVFISFIMGDLVYSPWKELTSYINTVSSKLDNGGIYENDYQLAVGIIKSLSVERNKLKRDVDNNKKDTLNNTIMNFCMGKTILSDLGDIKAIFPCKTYCVTVTDLEGSCEKRILVFKFLTRYIGIFYSNFKACNFIDEKGNLCTILNLSSYSTYNYEIFQKIKHINSTISERYNLTCYTGISNTYNEILDLPRSYKEAKKSLEYCFLKGNVSIMFFQDIEKVVFSSINIPVHSGNPLLNSVKVGDIDVCTRLLDEYFKNIANNTRSFSIHYMYCLFYSFTSVLLKACKDIGADFNVVFQLSPEQILDIDRYRNSREMIDSIYDMYKKFCKYVQNKRTSQNISLKVSVYKELNENYSNSNYSLIELADRLGYSSSYLSRFINQEFGIGFGEFLNSIRIEKAKEILAESLKQIGIVSDETGYTSVNTFIRTFKRVEGITPKQYRDMVSSNKNTF